MQKSNIFHLTFSLSLTLILTGSHVSLAATEEYKPISTYDALGRDREKANSRLLLLQSELALKNKNTEKAIKLGRAAINADPDDLDARVGVAEALYKKVEEEGKDGVAPAIFNECLTNWLIVYRNIAGEEATSYKGLSVPGASRFFADEGRTLKAKARIESLCGRTPKFWESNKRFLKRVLKPESRIEGQVLEEPKN